MARHCGIDVATCSSMATLPWGVSPLGFQACCSGAVRIALSHRGGHEQNRELNTMQVAISYLALSPLERELWAEERPANVNVSHVLLSCAPM